MPGHAFTVTWKGVPPAQLIPTPRGASLRARYSGTCASAAADLLALAHKFQRMLDSVELKSMAELAHLGRVSRARITQIMDLLMLAPDM